MRTKTYPKIGINGAIQRGAGWWCNSCQAWVEESHKAESPVEFLFGFPVIVDNGLGKDAVKMEMGDWSHWKKPNIT